MALDIDIGLAAERLASDLRDDWFRDPLEYKEILSPNIARQYLARHPECIRGNGAERFCLPKKGFVLRSALETAIFDRLLFQALVDGFARQCDEQISERVYSNRMPGRRSAKRMFRPGVEQWKLFTRDIDRVTRDAHGVLLATDLHDYFEWVYVSQLNRVIRHLCANAGTVPTAAIDALCCLLRRWSPTGGRGLPQNQDASSFLANLYLHDIDNYMISQGYNYYRYVDDIRIVCDCEYDARRALKVLILRLKQRKLSVNAKKTVILHPGMDAYDELVPPPNRTVEEIDALIKTKVVREQRRAMPKLKKLLLQLVRDGKTDRREFRFCVNRLETLARSTYAGSLDFSWATDPAIDMLMSQPWATDSAVRLLERLRLAPEQIDRIAAFMGDPARNIYERQGYNIWRLLAVVETAGQCERGRMRMCAHKSISGPWERPMKAGAIYYLGACGTEADRTMIARSFHRMRHSRLMARAVVLATQELPSGVLDRHVQPYLTSDMRTSLRRLRAAPEPSRYYEPAPTLRPADIFDAMPEAEPS